MQFGKKNKGLDKSKLISIIISFIIPIIIILVAFKSGGFAPFGNKDVISASKTPNTLFYIYEMYDHFHGTDSSQIVDNMGLTHDYLNDQMYYLSDPTNLIINAFSYDKIPAAIDILYLLKLSLGSVFMYIYLCSRKKSVLADDSSDGNEENKSANESDGKKKNIMLGGTKLSQSKAGRFLMSMDLISIALSVSFALSAYFLSEGLDITYLGAIILLPLIIMGIDNIIYKDKALTFIITLALSFMMNVYISIITLFIASLYYIVEAFSSGNDFLKGLRKYLGSAIVAFLLCAFTVIPFLNSFVFKDDISLSFINFAKLNNIWNTFNQFMFKATPSKLSLYDCGVNMYCGILLIPFVICFFINKKQSSKRKISYLLLICLLFSGLIFSTPNYALNFLKYFTNNTYIYGYFLIFLLIVIAFDSIMKINHVNKIAVTVAAVIPAIVILFTMKFAENLDTIKPLYYSLEILFVYYLITLIYRDKSMTKLLFSILLSLICIGEMSVSFISAMGAMGQSSYIRPTMDSFPYKQYAVSKYIRETEPDASILYYEGEKMDYDPLIMSLSGYDYIVVNETNSNLGENLEYVTTFKESGMVIGLSIYKNKYQINSALLPENITEYDYSHKDHFTSMNILSGNYLDAGNIYEITEGETSIIPAENTNAASISFTTEATENVFANGYYITPINNAGPNEPYSIYQETPADRFNEFYFQYGLFSHETMDKIVKDITSETGNKKLSLSGENEINASEAGYLLVPSRFAKNLSISVNGKEVTPVRFINDTTLVPVEKGNNKVIISYSLKYLILGIIISIITLLAMVIVLIKKEAICKLLNSKNTKKSFSGFLQENYVYVLTIALLTLIFIVSQMYTGSYPFGDKAVITGDGLSQGLPVYYESAKMLHDNTLSWISHSLGLTRDTYLTEFTFYILHFWDFLIFKLLPEKCYLMYFTVLFYLAYILNAISMIIYLTHRKENPFNKKDYRLIILASLYALSSFAIIFFSYKCFRIMFYFPLIILGLEKLVYDKKYPLYIISLSLMMIFDGYSAFIVCEAIGLIFLTMKFDDFKDFLKTSGRFIAASVIAAGISAFRLLPYFAMTQESGYVEGDSVLPSLTGFFRPITEVLSAYRPLNYIIAVSDNNSQNATYIGMITLLIIPLYALNKKIDMISRIKKLILLLFIFISFDNELLNFIMHGFHIQSLAPNRFAFVFIFMVIAMIGDEILTNEKLMDSKYVVVTAAITALYTLLHIFEKDFRQAGVITGFVILMLFLITGVVKLIGKNLKLEKVLVFIMLLDIIISGTYLMNGNFGSNSNLTRDADYINKLTDEYSELTEPFSGSVFLNNSNYNLAAMTDTQSPVYFYSGASVYTLNMYTKYNIYHSLNTIYYGTGNPFADMMMHTKYHMADAYNGNAQTWYPNVATVNNMNVYENPYYLPLGFMTDSDTTAKLTQWDTSKATYRDLFDYQNAFSQQITGKDFYNKIEINEINNIIETLPQEAVTDEQKDEEAGKDADAGSMDNPDASTMDNADEKSDKSSNNKLTGPDKIQSLNPLLNQTPDQMTNQNSDQPANQAADQTMEISIPDDISYFEIGPAEDASTNQLTVYNIPVYIHINASTIKPGEYYVSMRDYIMYLGNINDKDVDITITIPTHELFSDKSLIDSFAIAKLDNEAFTKVHDILATTTLTDITTKAGTINAALNNSEVGRLYISLPYSKNWEIKVDGKAVKAYVYLGGTGVDIPAGNHKIEMVYHTSGAYEGLIISIGTILILLLVIIYIKRKKTTDSE